jgi:O-antigen/teichoic acid export membrane protein
MSAHNHYDDKDAPTECSTTLRLAGQISIYGLGGIIGKACSFLLVPLLTRFLAPGEYGVLELLYMTGAVLGSLFGLCISSGYLREFPQADALTRRRLFGSAWWVIALTCGFFSIPLLLYVKPFGLWLTGSTIHSVHLAIMLGTTVLTAFNTLLLQHLIATQQARMHLFILTGTQLTYLLLAFLLLSLSQARVTGVLIAQFSSAALECLILSILFVRPKMLTCSWRAVSCMLTYSIPLIPMQLASFIMLLSDRWFIGRYAMLTDVGIYGVGNKLASIVGILAVYPLTALTPHIFKMADDDKRCRHFISNAGRIYMAGITCVAVPITLFSNELILLLSTSGYIRASSVVLLLNATHILYGYVIISSYGFHVRRKTWLTSLYWCGGALLNLLLNYALIPKLGMAGAAWSTFLSYAAVLFLYHLGLRRLYPVPLNLSRILPLMAVAAGLCLLGRYVATPLWQRLLLVGIGAGLLTSSGYFEKNEKQKLWALCKQVMGKHANTTN